MWWMAPAAKAFAICAICAIPSLAVCWAAALLCAAGVRDGDWWIGRGTERFMQRRCLPPVAWPSG